MFTASRMTTIGRNQGKEENVVMNTHAVLAVVLNPAWQKTLSFHHLRAGHVNRAQWKRECGGGKGVNMARALTCLQRPATVLQFAGGDAGDRLCTDMETLKIPHETVRIAQETRTCTTAISASEKSITELIEPSPRVSGVEQERMRRRGLEIAPRFGGIAICGTFPEGFNPDITAAFARRADPRAVVLLDGVRKVRHVLEERVDILKVNKDEILELSGCESVYEAAAWSLKQFASLQLIAITAGSKGAFLFSRDETREFRLPPLANVVNPIGAGDCVTGVFLSECTNLATASEAVPGGRARWAMDEVAAAFAYALACGSASCLAPLPGDFSTHNATRIHRSIQVGESD